MIDFFIVYVFKVLCNLPEPNCKDMQAMTAERVRVCSEFAKRSSPLLMKLHRSEHVTQLNSVPENSRCAVTGVHLERNNGVQILSDTFHVCVHADVMNKWFHYFRLRHFPHYMCGLILEWVKRQPWYLHNRNIDISALSGSHWVHTYKRMYAESIAVLS